MIIVIAMPMAACTALRANTRPEGADHRERPEDAEQDCLAGARHEVTSASSLLRVCASTYSRWASVAEETLPR